MSGWSTLRRSTLQSITRPLYHRHFSTTNIQHQHKSNFFLKWISGIISTSTLALALYSNYTPSVSFADDTSQQSLNHHHPPKYLFGEGYRRKVFFNYEKRIRMRSPPEKVFEYFASFEADDGEIFMTPADLMRAVVPVFPPSESHRVRDGSLRGERSPGELRCAPSKFFMLFDTNSDGRVSFKEYIFLVTLLSIPESSFSVAFKMFDLDCNGEIDSDEFKKVMTLMRAHNRQGAHHSDGLRGGRNLGGHIENGGLLQDFFGEDGKERLQYDKFVQFLRDLHEEMIKLEFAHYDYKSRGTISAKDFALSMVASADLKYLSKLLDRVDYLDNDPQLSRIRISFEEFKCFAELRKKLQPFALALFCFGQMNGLLTRNDFRRAASQVCGVSLTDNVIEIIFHVFDTNHDGRLSSDEFIRVLEKRERDIAEPTEAGKSWHNSSNYSVGGLFKPWKPPLAKIQGKVAGKESAIAQVARTTIGKMYQLTFKVGDASESCEGAMIVGPLLESTLLKSLMSKGKGGFKAAVLRFKATANRSLFMFLSYHYLTRSDDLVSLFGAVVDEMKLLGVRNHRQFLRHEF